MLLCYPCKVKHISHPKRKSHQVVKFSGEADLVKIENLICSKHDKPFSLYCFQDECPICEDCNIPHQVEVNEDAAATAGNKDIDAGEESKVKTVIIDEHKGHYVKTLSQVISQAD